ncbi:hypothetical protein [Jannaschia sp. CCS1]|uniref:hypothetical protein n=1 Tax=Jannaschia sp. (strain CCS1) TaxID=290400 RepID=UPI000053A4B9|nr:hypothetical protein [Jannaschia sp. CCS1]ABD55482.1 hypothetical protein Jann_2565 [Jannaschia sp. CCS1]
MAPAVQYAEGLSITLTNTAPSEPWTAVSVVVTQADHRHRITFVAEQPMELVFCKEIVDVLRPILANFAGAEADSVYSNPDLEIALPGLSMRQLRVIYSSHGEDPSRVLIRFAAFVGNPHRALLRDDGFSHPMDALTSKVYRDALDWVLMPALNIVTVDETSGFNAEDTHDLEDAMAHLRESKDRLLFQVELVKRELGRLEAHTYSQARPQPVLLAAEPEQEEFRTLRVIREMD